MLAFNLLAWWYSEGWHNFISDSLLGIRGIADRFSIKTLFLTLFEPFRQIDSESSESNAISEKFQAFIARSVSRVIGAMTRLVLIMVGIVFIILYSLAKFVIVIVWPVVPFLPIVGIVLSTTGVGL